MCACVRQGRVHDDVGAANIQKIVSAVLLGLAASGLHAMHPRHLSA